MNTKIWLDEVSFGFNFAKLRAIGSTRYWWYFLVHIFKIKKFKSISSNGSRDIAESLKMSFGSSFISLRAFRWKFWQFRLTVYTLQTKKPHSIIFIRSWVLVYIIFAHGRTDRHFSKKFSFFFLIKNIYTCRYLSRLFFKFHAHSDQSSYTFFPSWKSVWQYLPA